MGSFLCSSFCSCLTKMQHKLQLYPHKANVLVGKCLCLLKQPRFCILFLLLLFHKQFTSPSWPCIPVSESTHAETSTVIFQHFIDVLNRECQNSVIQPPIVFKQFHWQEAFSLLHSAHDCGVIMSPHLRVLFYFSHSSDPWDVL